MDSLKGDEIVEAEFAENPDQQLSSENPADQDFEKTQIQDSDYIAAEQACKGASEIYGTESSQGEDVVLLDSDKLVSDLDLDLDLRKKETSRFRSRSESVLNEDPDSENSVSKCLEVEESAKLDPEMLRVQETPAVNKTMNRDDTKQTVAEDNLKFSDTGCEAGDSVKGNLSIEELSCDDTADQSEIDSANQSDNKQAMSVKLAPDNPNQLGASELEDTKSSPKESFEERSSSCNIDSITNVTTHGDDDIDQMHGEAAQDSSSKEKADIACAGDGAESELTSKAGASDNERSVQKECNIQTEYRESKLGGKERIDTQSSNINKDPFDLDTDEIDDQDPTRKYRPIKRKYSSLQYCDESCDYDETEDYYDWDYGDRGEGKILKHPLKDQVLMSLPERGRIQTKLRVAYVHSDELVSRTGRLIKFQRRAQLVHGLIKAYQLLGFLKVEEPKPASDDEILGFHCRDYIDILKKVGSYSDEEDDSCISKEEVEAYGLAYDCPLQEGIFETASLMAGATIAAAQALTSFRADVAINWCGGWHHAKRDGASGFCYINDIVLGILTLRTKYARVLYVDLDLHHGDGVEEAFASSPKVMTVSFHKYSAGFYPGTGGVNSTGTGKGKLYSVNVPLQDGICDEMFYAVFCKVMNVVREAFLPLAIVIQCGADGLAGDPMASFNLTLVGLARCVCYLLSWKRPVLLLGGGGYNFPNTAKCWTYITAMAANKRLEMDIPEHEYLLKYGPDYQMTTTPGNRRDCNTKPYLANLVTKIQKNLRSIALGMDYDVLTSRRGFPVY